MRFLPIAAVLALASCAAVAPMGYAVEPVTILTTMGGLLFGVLLYIAHYRLQKLVAKFDEAADSIATLDYLRAAADHEQVSHANTLSLFSSQLKGTGERLRKIEAQQAADGQTIESLLKLPRPLVDDCARMSIKALSAKMFGGTMPGENAMAVPGELSQLRQQVEGINSNLGNRMKRMEDMDRQAVKLIVERETRRTMEAIFVEIDKGLPKEKPKKRKASWRSALRKKK